MYRAEIEGYFVPHMQHNSELRSCNRLLSLYFGETMSSASSNDLIRTLRSRRNLHEQLRTLAVRDQCLQNLLGKRPALLLLSAAVDRVASSIKIPANASRLFACAPPRPQ